MKAMPYHETAEHNAAAHMRALGFKDARATKRGADGGIDVMAREAVAQVKMHMKPVGAPDLQRLYGARGVHHHRKMLFYSFSGYSPKAIAYAQTADIMLFILDLEGNAEPVNAAARESVKLASGKVTAPHAGDNMTAARQEAARKIAERTATAKAQYAQQKSAMRASWEAKQRASKPATSKLGTPQQQVVWQKRLREEAERKAARPQQSTPGNTPKLAPPHPPTSNPRPGIDWSRLGQEMRAVFGVFLVVVCGLISGFWVLGFIVSIFDPDVSPRWAALMASFVLAVFFGWLGRLGLRLFKRNNI